ncbi:MAG: HD domain-containing protein [Alphaproteobacteria bacterium]|nr:HD domain-containing protein [Alphaproteobacteria bacterium]
MLKEAYELLKEQYNACRQIVARDEYYLHFAKEKWRHSLQVMGAGNYLVRHIESLQNQSSDYIELVKTAVLLHDVCRFSEIVHLHHGVKGYNHGVAGSELLKNMPRFMDIRIWLPIKHHGHMIEDLYADKEYQSIKDKKLQKAVEEICFIIRDADKIANLHMLAEEPDMRSLFFGEENFKEGLVSDGAKKEALSGVVVGREYRNNRTSSLVTYLSWYADINYRAAIDYCQKLGTTDKLLSMFNQLCTDKEFSVSYTEVILKMLKEKAYLS